MEERFGCQWSDESEGASLVLPVEGEILDALELLGCQVDGVFTVEDGGDNTRGQECAGVPRVLIERSGSICRH